MEMYPLPEVWHAARPEVIVLWGGVRERLDGGGGPATAVVGAQVDAQARLEHERAEADRTLKETFKKGEQLLAQQHQEWSNRLAQVSLERIGGGLIFLSIVCLFNCCCSLIWLE